MRRRKFLKTLLGGGAVVGATQLVNAPIAQAGTDGDVVLGDVNNASAQTSIVATGATALHLEADSNFSLYAAPKTGSSADVIAVYGLGQGVGAGVRGDAGSNGIGVHAQNTSGGTALKVGGPMDYTRSGVVDISYPSASATLSGPKIYASTMILATVQNGVGVWVQAAIPTPGSPGSFKIVLNKAAGSGSHPKSAKVAWMLID